MITTKIKKISKPVTILDKKRKNVTVRLKSKTVEEMLGKSFADLLREAMTK